MPRPQIVHVSLVSLVLLAAPLVAGCGSAAQELEAARAVEQEGDLAAAIAAYEAVYDAHPHGRYGDEAQEAAQAARQQLAEQAMANAATLFDLPDKCVVVETASVTPADYGVRVVLALDCDGQRGQTGGRVIGEDKVWDITPIQGVLEEEGNCVFRSHGNPLGDWSLQVASKECHAQQKMRQGTLDRIGKGDGEASFECDCRLGEAVYEIPRGDPGWAKPPMVYTDKQGNLVDAPL